MRLQPPMTLLTNRNDPGQKARLEAGVIRISDGCDIVQLFSKSQPLVLAHHRVKFAGLCVPTH
jgi:hypothetical protein